ncbi:MAG: TRAP transporter substrate-binding protein DctP [Desulfatibacillaceae bacterium]
MRTIFAQTSSTPALLLVVLAILAWDCRVVRAADAPIQWRAGTLAPKRVGWAKQVEQMVIPALTTCTQGNVEVKVYWGGIMGDDEEIIEKMEKGILQIGGLAAQGSFIAVPEFSVVGLPFMFKNYNEVDYIRGKMFGTFVDLAARRGFWLYLWLDQDFDQIYSVKWKLDSVDAFSDATFVNWYGELEKDCVEKWGAASVKVDVPEISAAMRGGRADTLFGPALWMVGAQMYSVVKFVHPYMIRYSPVTIMNTMESMGAIPEEHRNCIRGGSLDLAMRFVEETRKDNASALQTMLEYGLQEVSMPAGEMVRLRNRSMQLWEEKAGALYPGELLEEMLSYLEEYRSQQEEP